MRDPDSESHRVIYRVLVIFAILLAYGVIWFMAGFSWAEAVGIC